jgi:hypothetical protein
MTVRSTNYSSIEEVWGEPLSQSSKTKKEKRKKIVDPICELYEMGNNNGFNENDLVNYANNYFERQDKEKNREFQKTMNDYVSTHPTPSTNSYREKPERHVVFEHGKDYYDVVDNDENIDDMAEIRDHVQTNQKTEQPPAYVKQEMSYTPSTRYGKGIDIDDIEEFESPKSSSFAFIDLLLYIVSGIILIFVMEQFVKIGLLLQ